MDSRIVSVKGRICSGRALASQHLAQHCEQLSELLGGSPQPGSLNIILPKPLNLSTESGVWLGQDRHRMVWQAQLEGHRILLYRWSGCPLSVVEIISDVHLRSKLKLEDGDTVTINICRNNFDNIRWRTFLGWLILWKWRTSLYYKNDYEKWIVSAQHYFDGNIGVSTLLKKLTGNFFGILFKTIRKKILRRKSINNFHFIRKNPGPEGEADLNRIMNLLNYTKLSGSAYSANKYPAGYHTLVLSDRVLAGQRLPSARLDLLPISLEGLTILDVGCNQGGMLFEAETRGIHWGVGIDYDSRMINAANKIKQYRGLGNLDFFVFDLEKEPLPLVNDFLQSERVDMVFLLSVCMWIDNWRSVIDFCSRLAPYMLFESNGSDEAQDEQAKYLMDHYSEVSVLQLMSKDDNEQKMRRLYFCSH